MGNTSTIFALEVCYDINGDNMKQNKKVFLVALLIGFGVIYFYNSKFDTTIVTKALAPEATIIYVGAYNDLDKANLKKEEYPEAIIYNNENVYK